MSFYRITVGQLITLWFFGLIISIALFLMGAGGYEVSPFYVIFSFLILGGLIFYSLGWKKHKEQKNPMDAKTGFFKRMFIRILHVFNYFRLILQKNLKKSLSILASVLLISWLLGGGYSFLSKTISAIEWREYAYSISDSQKVIQKYQEEADAGDAYAQFKLGLAYSSGKGIKKDHVSAVQWLAKAADQGEAHAQFLLAFAYKNGDGVIQDNEKFIELLKKSAEQNEASAMLSLGKEYLSGDILDQDSLIADDYFQEALIIFREEAQAGDPLAIRKLGLMHANGHAVTVNYEKAIELLDRAVQKGDDQSQYILGYIYSRGIWGVEKNDDKSFELFKQAAKGGNSDSKSEVGISYYIGRGTTQDKISARTWIQQAAEEDITHAKYVLGLMNKNQEGLGFSSYAGLDNKNEYLESAFRWFGEAADEGHHRAQYELSKLYEDGAGTTRNYEESLKWLSRSAENNHAEAQLEFGDEYQYGNRVVADRNEAKKWWELAGKHGDADVRLQVSYRLWDEPIESYKWALLSAADGNQEAKERIESMEMYHLSQEDIKKAQELTSLFHKDASMLGDKSE